MLAARSSSILASFILLANGETQTLFLLYSRQALAFWPELARGQNHHGLLCCTMYRTYRSCTSLLRTWLAPRDAEGGSELSVLVLIPMRGESYMYVHVHVHVPTRSSTASAAPAAQSQSQSLLRIRPPRSHSNTAAAVAPPAAHGAATPAA